MRLVLAALLESQKSLKVVRLKMKTNNHILSFVVYKSDLVP